MEGLALALPGFIAFEPEWLAVRDAYAALAIPASESALRSRPSVAVPPAQAIAILNPTSGVSGEFTLFYWHRRLSSDHFYCFCPNSNRSASNRKKGISLRRLLGW
jgi:hypothetical protein